MRIIIFFIFNSNIFVYLFGSALHYAVTAVAVVDVVIINSLRNEFDASGHFECVCVCARAFLFCFLLFSILLFHCFYSLFAMLGKNDNAFLVELSSIWRNHNVEYVCRQEDK